MPNWCDNRLHVRGSKADVDAFVKKAQGIAGIPYLPEEESPANGIEDKLKREECVLSTFALYPAPMEVLRASYDKVGYDWEHRHYGVKWGICQPSMTERTDEYVSYDFQTAWGPPSEFFVKVSKDFPNLSFTLEYCEPGMSFGGINTYEQGQCSEEELDWKDAYERINGEPPEEEEDNSDSGPASPIKNIPIPKGFTTAGATAKDDHENGNLRPEKNFHKFLSKYSKALAEALGYEHDGTGKKGKRQICSTNIAPAGGDGHIVLWKPGTDIGVYISINVRRDGDDLVTEDRFMWRSTTKKDKWTGNSNNWADRTIKLEDFVNKIKTEVEFQLSKPKGATK